jgi:hypothetical protein
MNKWIYLPALLAFAAMGTAAGAAAAQSTAWERNFDKNTEFTGTMTPRNDSLAIFCAVGGHASIVLKAPVFRTRVADKHVYSIVFAIDGERREFVMTAHDEDLVLEATDLNVRSQIEQFVAALSAGKTLTAAGQKLGWRADFSLDGAQEALEGILSGC